MDSHTALQLIDRDHEETLLWVHADQDALHVGEWSPGDAHPLPLPEIRVGKDRVAGVEKSLDRLDLRIRDDGELVPALPEDAHQPARLVDLEIACLVHRVAQEEIAPEHRDARAAPDPAAARPRLDDGEEQIKALLGELVMDEALAIAVRPQDVPARDHRICDDFWQGFAPFGLHPSPGCGTNH